MNGANETWLEKISGVLPRRTRAPDAQPRLILIPMRSGHSPANKLHSLRLHANFSQGSLRLFNRSNALFVALTILRCANFVNRYERNEKLSLMSEQRGRWNYSINVHESIPRIESKIRKWRFFGKLPPQATGFLRVHASKKREERVASKVKKGRGRKRRSGGRRGLRYREGGRRVPRIRDIVRQRFEPVGTRGQRCLQCRGKGEPSVFPQVDDHEERLPWLMKQHHEGNWLLTSNRTRSKPRFVYDYESKFRRLEKKNFAKSFPKKFHVFFIYNYTTTCQNIDCKSLEFLENERIHRSYDENVRSGTT